MASEVLQSISRDEQERAIFRSRRMYQRDMDSNMAAVKQNGINEGIIQGRIDGIISVARNALIKGMTITDIADITGLSYREIEDLRSKI